MAARWETMEKIMAPHFIPRFGPLNGMRVLLTGSIVAAPFGAQLLADFGAEVIHVELPVIGDSYRTQRPAIVSEDGSKEMAAAWCQKRNELSFALNLNLKKSPKSKEIFYSLIKQVDVWMENVVWLDKLGIDCKELLQINPKLVIVHVSGFGRPQFGGDPNICDRASYDPIGQCEGGLANMVGFPDGPPIYGNPFLNDYLTAVYAFGACCAGYINVLKGGLGQEIDLAQVETQARNLDDHWACYMNLGIEKSRVGNRVPIFQPASMHKCKDGRYAFIGAFGKAAYDRCLRGLGLDPDLPQWDWQVAGATKAAVDSPEGQALYAHLDKWFGERTAQEAQDHMSKFKTPVGIVKAPKDMYADPHWHSRGNFIKYKVPAIDDREIEAFGFVPKFMDTPGQVWRGQVDVGGDTERVLNELLGYSQEEIASMQGQDIID
ncbi:MAG TPA: CoA transferase [Syntrophomonadaceae bacterium]|nr:CoA transferase [Syntrophomonadaceae bacterium]